MTTVILRFFEAGTKVYSVDPDYVEENTDPCTDLVLSFDAAGKFITAQLAKRNEEQSSDNNETELVG